MDRTGQHTNHKITTFEIVFIPIIFFEEFVKRSLIGIIQLLVEIENWNFYKKSSKKIKRSKTSNDRA